MCALEKNYTYEEMRARMQKLAGQYPQFIHLDAIGTSHDGREILSLTMGNPRKALFCTAGIHGRESVNPIVLIRIMENYARAYREKAPVRGQSYTIYELLSRYGISFVPLANPDGYEVACRGFERIRNPKLRRELEAQSIPAREWKRNARGVDINRNFPCRSYRPQREGDAPASENETKALMQLFQSCDSIGYVDFHSRGKIIYYHRQAMSDDYNQYSYQLAQYLQDLSGYQIGGPEEEFQTPGSGGNSVNYYSETLQMPAITVETVEESASFPLHTRYQKETYEEIHRIPLGIVFKIAAWEEEQP